MDLQSKLENLKFAQSMLVEIARRTDAAGEKLLTYLIQMAHSEAEDRITELNERQPASRERF